MHMPERSEPPLHGSSNSHDLARRMISKCSQPFPDSYSDFQLSRSVQQRSTSCDTSDYMRCGSAAQPTSLLRGQGASAAWASMKPVSCVSNPQTHIDFAPQALGWGFLQLGRQGESSAWAAMKPVRPCLYSAQTGCVIRIRDMNLDRLEGAVGCRSACSPPSCLT